MNIEQSNYEPRNAIKNANDYVLSGVYSITVPETPIDRMVLLYANAENSQLRLLDDTAGYICDFSSDAPALDLYEQKLISEYNKQTPTAVLDALKSEKKRQIKAIAERLILGKYPIYKQLNITELQGYTEDERSEMWEYINSIREQSNTFESEVSGKKKPETVSNYVINYTV